MQQIYTITNTINNKIYVGKSKNYKKRFETHLKNARKRINRYLYDAMNHYGYENFIVELVEEVDDEHANKKEKYYILAYNSLYPNGYNMTNGGDGGYTLKNWPVEKRNELYSQQAKNRIGFRHSEETKSVLRQKTKQRMNSLTTDERKALSEKITSTMLHKGITPPKEFWSKKGCKGFFSGHSHTTESRNKMSAARKGKNIYEILGDEEAANKFKDAQRQRFTGSTNPRYVDFTEYHVNIMLSILCERKAGMDELSKEASISIYKIRQWLRCNGVDNYQRLMYDKNQDEWIVFWRKINASRNL